MSVDPKWRGVQGGITRNDLDPPDTQRVTLEVVGPTGYRLCQVIVISDQARQMAVIDPLGVVLDRMVAKLDEALHA